MAKAKSEQKPRRKKSKRGRNGEGRPSKYDPAFCSLATKFCLLGATNATLAKNFEVTTTTIDKWIKEIPEFSGAIKKGREQADAEIGASLYARAKGYAHPDVHISNYQGRITVTKIVKYYPPDTGAACMWLKNRRPDLWSDRTEFSIGDPQGIARGIREMVGALFAVAP